MSFHHSNVSLIKDLKKKIHNKSVAIAYSNVVCFFFIFCLLSSRLWLFGYFLYHCFFFELSKLWNINNQSLLKWFCDNTLLTIFIITCPHATISFQSVQTVYFTKNPFPYLLYIETLHVIMDILVLWFPILI